MCEHKFTVHNARMSIVFKSKATGDLFMVSRHAEQVLARINKSAIQAGILQPHEMPHALAVLRQLPDLTLPDDQEDQVRLDGLESVDGIPMSDGISLRKRAWPLVCMIESAMAANQAIVWGV